MKLNVPEIPKGIPSEPSTRKLYNLLKWAEPEKVSSDNMSTVKEI